jgi:hypothetical protein
METAMTLESRTFSKLDNIRWLLKYARSLFVKVLNDDGLELEIALRPKARVKNSFAAGALPKDARDWEEHGYRFRFSRRKYLWNDLPLHVTAGEALFLYRWLAQGSFNASEKYYLYNLRKRYGNAFLAEALEKVKRASRRAGAAPEDSEEEAAERP